MNNFKTFKVLAFLLLLFFNNVFGQIPTGYYSSADSKTGAELKTALYNIIKDHTSISYDQLWTAFPNTDKKSNGKVWDMYSDIPGSTPPYEYTYTSDQCGTYSGEGDCYNREHSFPKSWFNDATPMYTDLFHLYPTDGYVNGRRSNYPFGEVSSVTWTSQNGSKLGTTTASGSTITVFEPIDAYKGDFARTYFYMATRYENLIASWKNNTTETQEFLDGTSYPAFQDWYIQLLLKWNQEDPVSQKEIDRNNVIYSNYQHNRNPFIDHPEYAQEIWGNGDIPITFTSSPSTSAQVNVTYSYNVTVIGNSGATFTITATTKPAWLTLSATGNGTATLSGTPTDTNIGNNAVVLSASDGTNSTTQEFTITVSTIANSLQFTSTPIAAAQVNTAYSYSITASNNSGETITIGSSTKPSWLTLTSTGNGTATLTGTPSSSDIGSNSVVLTANDGIENIQQSFSINVTSSSTSGDWLGETFENMPASSSTYAAINWIGNNGINWSSNLARTDLTINTRAICLKKTTSPLPYVQSETISGGCTNIRFKHQQPYTTTGGIITLYVNDVEIGTANVSTSVQTSEFIVNESGNFVIKLVSNGITQIAIDDVEWLQPTATPNALPEISAVTAIPSDPVTGQAINISANATDSDGTVTKVLLNWGQTTDANEFSSGMTGSSNNYAATIPAQSLAGTIYFKIFAIDNAEDTTDYSSSIDISENQLPTITNISINPSNPISTSNVVVSAQVADPENRLGDVNLKWGLAENNLNNQLLMTSSGSTFSATIPSQSGGQTVYYQVFAIDAENNESSSTISNYYVETSTSGNELPVISNISTNPAEPVTGQSVRISADISDSDGTLIKVNLNWGLNSSNYDHNLEMGEAGGSYSATIPEQAIAGTIYFQIEAIDNSNDTAKFSQSVDIDLNQNPQIGEITISPTDPTSTDNVEITSQVIDPENRLSNVTLFWGMSESSLNNQIVMTNTLSTYSATIPGQVTGTTVYYRIIATDAENYQSQSNILHYLVTEVNQLPNISNVIITPASPVTGQAIQVSCDAVDNDGSIARVYMEWGFSEENLSNSSDLSGDGDIYSVVIPVQSQAGTLYFRIFAVDNRGDSAIQLENVSISQNQAPTISNVTSTPTSPSSTDNVEISAQVIDPEGRLNQVILNWGLSSSSLSNELTMTNTSSTFSAIIPSQAAGTTVYYRIKATDQENYESYSDILQYTENQLPTISNLTINPSNPVTGQAINISATITDSDGSISKVLFDWGKTLEYGNSSEMEINGNDYSVTIGSQSQAGTIYFRIIAVDNLEDSSTFTQSIEILTNQLPVISNITITPENPTSENGVIVSAQVLDPEGRNSSVFLLWGLSESNLNNQSSMSNASGTYSATIPVQASESTVYYRIKAFDAENNQSLSDILNYTVSPATGIGDNQKEISVNIYPNPVKETLYIDINTSSTCNIVITNIIGKVVYSKQFNNNRNIQINLNGFANGVYVVKIVNNGKTTLSRIIKQ